jgi:hypothetical protein
MSREYNCGNCGRLFMRPYRMNTTRAARPQYCKPECVAAFNATRSEGRDERFLARIQKGAADDCWPWMGRLDPNGYGRIDRDRKPRLAHRIAFFLANQNADQSFVVCHSCDNPRCCNPAHLWLGTQIDNVNDMIAKGRHWWRDAV